MDKDQGWEKHWGSKTTVKRLKNINTAYSEVVKLLLDLTNEKSNCIELGCGSGTYAIELLVNHRKCISSDSSERALELARIKGKELYDIDVPTELVDIYHIPYSNDTFDLVFSDGVIEHLEISKAFTEIKRVIKPDGWMVAKVPSGSLLYKIVYYALSPVENRPFEAWLSQKQWYDIIANAGYKNITICKCGSVLAGLTMRITALRFLKYLPPIGKIHFLIKAQK